MKTILIGDDSKMAIPVTISDLVAGNCPYDQPINLDLNEVSQLWINGLGTSGLEVYKESYFRTKFLANSSQYRITRLKNTAEKVTFTKIINLKEKEITISNEELRQFKKCGFKIYYTEKLDQPLGNGWEGMVWRQITSENSSLACKFKKTHEKEEFQIRKLDEIDRLKSLKGTIALATAGSKVQKNAHVMQFIGVIFAKELNQYGLIYEEIKGRSLADYIRSINAESDGERIKKIVKVCKEVMAGLKVLSEARMPHTDLLQESYNVMVRHSDDSAVVIDIDGETIDDNANWKKMDLKSKQQFAIMICDFLAKKRFGKAEDASCFLSESGYSETFISTMTNCLSSEDISWDQISKGIDALL